MTPLPPSLDALHLTPRQYGARLEDVLAWLHARYRADRLATVKHVGTRAIKVGNEWIPQDSEPDYDGILWHSGRSIKFDAKHCQEDVYRHDTKRCGHQLISLWGAHEAGAIAGLLVCNLDAGRGWWLTPSPEWAVGQFEARHVGDSDVINVVLGRCIVVRAHSDFEGGYVPNWLEAVTR